MNIFRKHISVGMRLTSWAAICVLTLIAVTPAPAYAYVDPSVITYTIQALAGVVVALSAVFGVAFRRTRKIILKALKIDENARKEVEPDCHRVGPDGGIIRTDISSEASGESSANDTPSGKTASAAEIGNKPRWKRRFMLSLIVTMFCGLTLGIVAPFETVAGNTASLMFGLKDIWLLMTLFTAAASIILALGLSLIPGRAFTFALTLVFCGGLCCYVQAMFLNTGLPSADGNAVNFWDDHFTMIIISSIVWAVLLIIPPIVSQINRYRAQSIVCVLSVCLILVQGAGVVSLFFSDGEEPAGSEVVQVTEEGLFKVSPHNNVIVFVLDHFDTRLMDQLLEENPALFDNMPGFTYYENSLSMMLPTRFSLPYLLTHEEPLPGEDINSYYTERFTRSTFLEELGSLNYSVGIYASDIGLEQLSYEDRHAQIADSTINIHGIESTSINKAGTISSLAKCALYRDMPWIAKWRFWFYTDEVNAKAIDYDLNANPADSIYLLDDPRYYERLQHYGLSLENGDRDGAFRLIHLTGAHTPFTMGPQAEYLGLNASTESDQALGALFIVESYLQKLKDLGAYDGATIIIMSDHGSWEGSLDLPGEISSPILLMKPSGAETSDGTLQVSYAPVSHENFHATVLEAMGSDGSIYGETIEEASSKGTTANGGLDDPRTTYMVTHDAVGIVSLLKYEVVGDALDFSNWSFTGETWAVDEWKTTL